MCQCLTLCVQSHICGILVRRPLRIKTDCICQLWDNLQRVCSRSVLYQIYENTQACVHGLSIYTHTHTHSLWWIWLMKRLKQCQWVLFLIWLPSTAELHTVPALIPLSIFVFQILTFSLTPLKMKNIHTFTHTLGLMCTAWKSSAIIRCVCVRAKKSRCFFLVSRDTDAQAQEMSSLTEMFTLFRPGNERKMSDRTIRGRWASRSTAEYIYISCRPLLWRCG